MSLRFRHARGVTLVELIVGILLVGIALTLILPYIVKVRTQASGQAGVNNLRRMGEGVRVYHDIYQSFPSQPKGKQK